MKTGRDGKEANIHNLAVRIAPTLFERLSVAWTDCQMTQSDWLRAVLEAAVELHEEQAAAPTIPEPETWDDVPADPAAYEAALNEAAQAERRRLTGQRPQPAATRQTYRYPSFRDCPHMMSDRRPSGRCAGCGANVGARHTHRR